MKNILILSILLSSYLFATNPYATNPYASDSANKNNQKIEFGSDLGTRGFEIDRRNKKSSIDKGSFKNKFKNREKKNSLLLKKIKDCEYDAKTKSDKQKCWQVKGYENQYKNAYKYSKGKNYQADIDKARNNDFFKSLEQKDKKYSSQSDKVRDNQNKGIVDINKGIIDINKVDLNKYKGIKMQKSEFDQINSFSLKK